MSEYDKIVTVPKSWLQTKDGSHYLVNVKLKEEFVELQKESEHWKDFARWVAEQLFNWSLSPEEWEGLQKEFEELTEKEDFPIKETKRKEVIEKLEQILDILYDEKNIL